MRPGRVVVFVLVVGVTRLIGCGSTVTAANYDQTCVWACSTPCMEFPSADAISHKASASYSYDAVEAQYHCSHCGSTLGNCSGNAAAAKSAYCSAGKCTICDDPREGRARGRERSRGRDVT
jgi:hypothetical protein